MYIQMKIHDLQTIVIAEGICLALIVVIIISAFKRWRHILIASSILASVVFFCAWSNIMAFGCMLVYGSASTLLWWQLDNNSTSNTNITKKRVQTIAWTVLATGVLVLIINNTHNIFIYLG